MVNNEKIRELLKMKSIEQKMKSIEQKMLAEEVGISEAMMSYIINGLKEPSLTILGRIAKALGVPAAELIVEE